MYAVCILIYLSIYLSGLVAGGARAQLVVLERNWWWFLEMAIESTWSWCYLHLERALGGRDRASVEMHLEAVIE